MRIAIIESGTVKTIVESTLEHEQQFHTTCIEIQNGSLVSSGWAWNGQQFIDPVPPKTFADQVKDYTDAIQAHLDTEARTRNYDGILSLASYATSKNPRFSAEGQAGVEWRDAIWAYAYAYLADVQAGKRGVLSVPDLLAALPKMVWPA